MLLRYNKLSILGFRNMKMKKALITGITWQDGSYLAELLRENGYKVFIPQEV